MVIIPENLVQVDVNPMSVAFKYPGCPLGEDHFCFCMIAGSGAVADSCISFSLSQDGEEASCKKVAIMGEEAK